MTAPRVVHIAVTADDLLILRSQLLAFRDAGYDVITMSAPDDRAAELLAVGIDHVAIPALTPAPSPVRDWKALRQLQRAFAGTAPEIVHTHHPKLSVLGRIAARRAGVPVMVNTVDGLAAISSDDWIRKGLACGVEKLAASWSDAELVQSIDDLELLRSLGVPDSKLTLIGSGVALSRYDPAAVPDRVREARRADLGADADTVLVGVIGSSADDRSCRELVAAATRCTDHSWLLVVMGPDDDTAEAYRALDVGVVASRRPGTDSTVSDAVMKDATMKAATMGLPLVADDLVEHRAVIVDEETGVLVAVHADPPADLHAGSQAAPHTDPHADKVVAAVLRLAGDRDLRGRMGAAARSRAVATFDERCVVATTLRTYDWLLSGSAPPAAHRARIRTSHGA